jgi:hypothetical protein
MRPVLLAAALEPGQKQVRRARAVVGQLVRSVSRGRGRRTACLPASTERRMPHRRCCTSISSEEQHHREAERGVRETHGALRTWEGLGKVRPERTQEAASRRFGSAKLTVCCVTDSEMV